MSTGFDDGATQVIATEDGGSFVLGYRQPDEAGGTEFFASRFDSAGKLTWLTALPGEANPSSGSVGGALVGDGLYVSSYTLGEGAEPVPLTLHKIGSDGTLLWSREALPAVNSATTPVAAPNGQLYISYLGYNADWSSKDGLVALSPEGKVLWEREEVATSLAAADSGVYLERGREILKYGADGTLLWSKALEPSVPGFAEDSAPEAGPFVDITPVADGFYLSMTYLYDTTDGPENATWNTEVRRYATDGTQTWAKVVFPVATGAARWATLPIGVTADGSFAALQQSVGTPEFESGAQMLRLSPGGELTTVKLTQTTRDTFINADGNLTVNDVALTTATVNGSVQDTYYAVGSTGTPPCQAAPCPSPDAYLSLYTLDETESEDQAGTSLLWSIR